MSSRRDRYFVRVADVSNSNTTEYILCDNTIDYIIYYKYTLGLVMNNDNIVLIFSISEFSRRCIYLHVDTSFNL